MKVTPQVSAIDGVPLKAPGKQGAAQ